METNGRRASAAGRLIMHGSVSRDLPLRLDGFRSVAEALDYAARGETGLNFYNLRGEVAARLHYRDLRESAVSLARRLAGRFERGARLAIVAETSPDFFVAFFACQYAGLIPAPMPMPVNLGGKEGYIQQIRAMIDGATAAAAIGPEELTGFLREAVGNPAATQVLDFGSLAALPDPGVEPQPFSPDEICYIQYSSGSTSAPKGVIGTQASVIANLHGITAHGLFAAAQAAEKHVLDFRIKNSSVIIQGFGNVGAPIAQKLASLGARIVGGSDINCALSHPEGLNVDELCAIRRTKTGLAGYTGPVRQRFDGEHLDRLLEQPCVLLVPAARPHAIHAQNTPHLNTRVVLQGANNPADLVCEYFLQHRRGVFCLTDFIVNSGGVIAAYVEAKADVDAAFRERVMAEDGTGRAFLEKLCSRIITENIDEMFGRLRDSRRRDITLREIAFEMAKDRLRPGPDGQLKVIPELL